MTTTPARPHIVVGVDDSECSKEALRWAARIAAAEGAAVDAVIAWSYPLTTSGWPAIPLAYDPKVDMEKLLTETIDAVFGSDRPENLRLHTVEGDAAHVLLRTSERALMIVVGSRGHGGFYGLLLGSVSAKVAEHATCPVLVVHAPKTVTEKVPATESSAAPATSAAEAAS